MAEKMSIDKLSPIKDDSDESLDSSAEAEAEHEHEAPAANAQQETQVPKRKGGRKPIYATSEERKQRNRQAQAAFRERRTEYIKQLEETIRVHEQNLHNLQAAHRTAADECLMLRYKNSLLERILLEKGIDVQAELRAKTGSPSLGPTHVPQNLVQPPPIQRAILNRHHARRSNSSIAPKSEPGVSPLAPAVPTPNPRSSAASPKSRPTPSSHSASPAATTSFGSQHGASPAGSGSDHLNPGIRTNLQPAIKAAQPFPGAGAMAVGPLPRPTLLQPLQPHGPAGRAVTVSVAQAGATGAPYYAAPAFQNHMEELEQEYDAAADMMEDPGDPPDTPSGPGPYPGAQYAGEPQPMSLSSPTTTAPPSAGTGHMAGHSPMDGAGPHTTHYGQYPSMTQLLDTGVDWDPFGLSASMAFPTQFSFDTSNMR